MLKLETLETRCLLSVSVTDSFLPNSDFEITFPETLTGWSGAPEQISIFNGGNDPLTISKLSLDSNNNLSTSDSNFTLEYPASVQTPPGYSSSIENLTPLPLETVLSDVIETPNDQDWFIFSADTNQVMDLKASSLTPFFAPSVAIYNSYGGEIETHHTANGQSFVTPYTGEYYARVNASPAGIATGGYNLEVLTTDDPIKPMNPGDSSNGFLSTSQGDDEIWFSFDGQYGDIVSMNLNSNASVSSNIEIMVFNSLGETVFSQDQLTRDTVEFPIFGDGTYFTRVISYANNGTDGPYLENNSYSLTLAKDDTIFNLAPNTTLNIPVWFMPSQAGEQEGFFHLEIDSNLNGQIELNEQYKISLYGSGVTGDMSPSEIHLPQLPFDYFAQSGQPLQVELTVDNIGSGNIIEYPNVQFFLSADDTLDSSDTELTSTLLSSNDTNPLHTLAGESFKVLTETNIPAGLNGQYYLFAAVNGDKAIDEEDYSNNTTVLEPLFIDPYDTIVYDNDALVYDYGIDFGKATIGHPTAPNQKFIGVYNRSDSAVSVDVIDLNATDGNFILNTEALDGIPVQPGEHRAVWVQFNPQEFSPDNNSGQLNDIVRIDTAQTEYNVTLSGTIQGPDLHVLETSDVANDDIMEFGSVQIGSSAAQTFTLANWGNQDLVINEVILPAPFSLTADSADRLNDGITLKAAEELLLTVQYNPVAINTDSAVLTINSSDESQLYSYTMTLNGNAVDPSLVITESAGVPNDNQINFGNHTLASQASGTTVIETMTLTNNGNGPLTFDSDLILASSNNQFAISDIRLIENGSTTDVTDLSQVTLLPDQGNTIEVDIQFLATDEGFSSGTLSIDTDFAGTHEVALSGFALSTMIDIVNEQGDLVENTLTFDPVVITYANPQPRTDQLFSITNNGTSNLSIYSIQIEGAGFGIGHPSAQDLFLPHFIELEPGRNISFKPVFAAPTPVAGDYTATMTINKNLPNERSVQLLATALTPEIDITTGDNPTTPTMIDFDTTDIGQTGVIPLTISNADGTAPLHVSWNTSDEQFSLAAPNYTLDAGEVRTVNLYYDPTVMGASQAEFTIVSDDLDENLTTITLMGNSEGTPLQEVSKKNPLTFFDADGNRVQIKLNEGTAKVYLNDGASNNADIARIELMGTTNKSTLSIKSNGEVSAGSILTQDDSSLKAIKAPNLNLNDSLAISGSLTSLQLNDIAEGASIAVGNSLSSKPMTLKVDHIGTDLNNDDAIDNVLFNIDGDIKSFKAAEFLGDTDNAPVTNLTANSIKSLTIKRGDLNASVKTADTLNKVSVYGSINGNLESGSDIGTVIAKRGSIDGSIIASGGNIKSIKAANDIDGFVAASHDIGKITSKGILQAAVRADNLKSVKADSLESAVISVSNYLGAVSIKNDVIDSNVLAGYDIGLSVDSPTDDGDLTAGEIKSFKFGGEFQSSYVTAGVMTEAIYNNLYSLLPSGAEYSSGQGTIKSVSGKFVQNDNDGVEFGFFSAGDIAKIKLPIKSGNFVIKTNA